MKKNNKGFFLVEAVVIISLVTIIMAYVYPNVNKIYNNFKYSTEVYDLPEDVYTLIAYRDMIVNGDLEIYDIYSNAEIIAACYIFTGSLII